MCTYHILKQKEEELEKEKAKKKIINSPFFAASCGVIGSLDPAEFILCNFGYTARVLEEREERDEKIPVVLLLWGLPFRLLGTHRRHHGTPSQRIPCEQHQRDS